ncbi:hypothetical protein HDU98_011920 [Podochytrium sp. JEL0797]|nr:hypothetical protein HDU98_011920 [Podochytrium sp. JEL0797]
MAIRHSLLFCMFWTKVVTAMLLALSCLMWFSWRIYDLHSRASPPPGPNLLSPVVIVGDNGTALASCAYEPSKGLARLEPVTNGMLMVGYSLDWSYDSPSKIASKLKGYNPPVFNAFMQLDPLQYGPVGFDVNMLNWFGSECGRTGSMLELSLEPINGVETVTPAMYDGVAVALLNINQRYGVPVFLRYAHEMNGNWNPYMMRPTTFIASWKQMTNAVRARTNMTAMVWAPNIGIAYPFSGTMQPQPANNSIDFQLLDTNKNGVLDELDDPYTPYYPGDDYVDWVGLSLYNYPQCYDCIVPPNMFVDYFTGTGSNSADTSGEGDPTNPGQPKPAFTAVHNFYKMFSADGVHNKPVMLPETGSPWIQDYANHDAKSVDEQTVKLGWYKQIMSTSVLAQFPKLKLVVSYEDRKQQDPLMLNANPYPWNDFKVTNTTSQLSWWVPFLNGFKANMLEGTDLKYGCDGSVTRK